MTPLTRLASGLLTVSTVLGLIPVSPAFAAAFTDIGSSPYNEAISSLKDKGVLEGYTDGSFKPGSGINRAEFLKIILRGSGITLTTETGCFPDVKDEWFAPYVCTAKKLEIIGGYPDGLFHPERDVNFVEAAKILSLAYKQQVEQGIEWYDGYASALESAKAIPSSIKGLDARLFRGEMAEIMWRLSEGKTDKKSIGVMNLRHPSLTISMASDDVQTGATCADLQAITEQRINTQTMYYDKSDGFGGMPGAARNSVAAPMAEQSAKAPPADHSTTNVQVEGVDEGDIVKTDGNNLYILSGQTVRILKANPGSALKKLSEISLASDLQKTKVGENSEYWGYSGGFQPSDLYVEGSTLVVVGSDYNASRPMPMERNMKMMAPIWNSARTAVRVYDISNAEKPSLVRDVSFEGNTVSSRRIGGKLYLVMNAQTSGWVNPAASSGVKAEDVLPVFDDSVKSTKSMAVAPCNKVAILPRIPNPQYLMVAVVPVDGSKADVQTTVILGNAENVYMSLENLYIAATDYQYHWMMPMEKSSEVSAPTEQTNIYRFSVNNAGVSFQTKGTVPGHLLNQFSMDEHEDTFRIATTTNQNWSVEGSRSENGLYVLDERTLDKLGSIENIAPGESIYSARFMGDRAYLVTFKQVDPLFVIDTSNPRSPKILGKLKIPGYSNYLHPIDDTHLLGIGKEVDESIDADKVHSDDAVYYTAIQGVKLAVFDVSDVSNPKEMWKEVIGDRGTESPVLSNHKALLYEPERRLLTLPIVVAKRPAGSAVNADGNPVFQGAYVYDLSLSTGFKLQGTITHYNSLDVFTKAGSYWYGSPLDIQRVVRIGESLLTISDGEVRSSSLKTLKEEASATYAVPDQPQVMY